MSVYGEITRTPLVDVTFPLYNNGISCAGDLLDRSVTCKFIDDNKNTVNTANSTSDNLMITHVNQNKMDTNSIKCENGETEIESTTDKTTNEKTSITCRRPDGNTYNYSKAGFTSNVYDFKSKRERNVESFSQNNNNKCKARY